MKIIKLERIDTEVEYPIVRITIDKDGDIATKDCIKNIYWSYMDTGIMTSIYFDSIIEYFVKMNIKTYEPNKTEF